MRGEFGAIPSSLLSRKDLMGDSLPGGVDCSLVLSVVRAWAPLKLLSLKKRTTTKDCLLSQILTESSPLTNARSSVTPSDCDQCEAEHSQLGERGNPSALQDNPLFSLFVGSTRELVWPGNRELDILSCLFVCREINNAA